MDKNQPPKAFGVFKPIGHIVMAFNTEDDLHAAQTSLSQKGFGDEDVVCYSPEEMIAQTADDMQSATALASVGQELNLVKAHRAFAEAGCSFLVVRASGDAEAERVAEVARSSHAAAAQRYGRFIVEELVSSPQSGDRQVAESADRGLDLDVDKQTRH